MVFSLLSSFSHCKYYPVLNRILEYHIAYSKQIPSSWLRMEATIFVLSSLATNLAGIYRQVPFTVVDPHHTFLERLVGSVQVSCTIYTLRYWHPLVFPEAAKYESRCEGPCESPAQNTTIELGGMLKNLMDQYVQKSNLVIPRPRNSGNSCSDQPPPLTTIHHTLFGRNFDMTSLSVRILSIYAGLSSSRPLY